MNELVSIITLLVSSMKTDYQSNNTRSLKVSYKIDLHVVRKCRTTACIFVPDLAQRKLKRNTEHSCSKMKVGSREVFTVGPFKCMSFISGKLVVKNFIDACNF